MATLGEVTEVPISNIQGKSLAVEELQQNNIAVITIEKKRIILYNISDRRILGDWTVPGDKISSPAIASVETSPLHAVLDKTTIYTWEKSNPRVQKGKKTVVDKPIYRLWAPSDRPNPYIVYSDGSVTSFDDPDVCIIDAQLQEKDHIVWNGQVRGDVCVLCLVCENQNNQMTCFVYDWQKDSDTVTCVKHTFDINAHDKCISYSLCSYMHRVYLFILDASPALKRVCILAKHGLIQDVIESLNAVPEVLKPCDINALDDHQIAILCEQTSPRSYGLGIWDAKFALMHSFKSLGERKSCDRLYKINNWLLVALDDGLYSCDYIPNAATLRAAVGSIKIGSNLIKLTPHVSDMNHLTDKQEMLSKLADRSKTSKAEKFHSVFTSFAKWLDDAPIDDLECLSAEISHLIKRIADETSFWPKPKVFQTLLNRNLLQGSDLTVLMPALIKHEETEIIYQILKKVPFIPESVIIQALSYFLRILPKLNTEEVEESTEDGIFNQEMYSEENVVYINTILMLPYNDVFLVQCLKEMEFPLAVNLLRYLSLLLSLLPASPQVATGSDTPSLLQVFDWCCLCIDAHLAQMIMSAEAKPIILKLYEQVKQQMTFFKELGGLDTILRQLKEKWNKKPKHGTKYYCIQTLHIH